MRTPAPDLLRLTPDGELVLADGGDAREYLKTFFVAAKAGEPLPVNIVTRKHLQDLYFIEALSSCA